MFYIFPFPPLKKGREKKTLFEKLFVSPNLLRSEKALFRTLTIQGFRGKSTLESEEPNLLDRLWLNGYGRYEMSRSGSILRGGVKLYRPAMQFLVDTGMVNEELAELGMDNSYILTGKQFIVDVGGGNQLPDSGSGR